MTTARKRRKKDFEEFERQEAAFKAKGGKTPKPEVVKAPIKLEKEKTGIAAYREKDTLGGRIVKTLTSGKTTLALAGTLATMGAGAALAAGAKATQIGTRLAASGKIIKLPSRLAKIGSKINVNAIGKAHGLTKAQTASLAKAVSYERINVIARYAVNPKSTALSTKILVGAGISLGAASVARDIIGTYPFAGFIKEEALQTTGFPIKAALDAGDLEGAQKQLDQSNELLSYDTTKIPYANVQQNLNAYFDSQTLANQEWQRLIDEAKLQAETESTGEFESPFEKSAREKEERDIETQTRIDEGIAESEDRFQKRQEEIEEGIEARDEAERIKFEEIKRENEERDRINTMFYEAIRKRNAGVALTDEEKELLMSKGVDPNPFSQAGGSSALSFGLLK